MQLRKRELSDQEYYEKAAEIKAQIVSLSEKPAKHLGVRKWQDFYVEKAARLYQWSADRRIPAENNYAEREIRKTVIARKISYGSQSEKGAKTREIWTSVLESLKKREDDPRRKLVATLNKLNDDQELNLAQELFG
jgi:transposase